MVLAGVLTDHAQILRVEVGHGRRRALNSRQSRWHVRSKRTLCRIPMEPVGASPLTNGQRMGALVPPRAGSGSSSCPIAPPLRGAPAWSMPAATAVAFAGDSPSVERTPAPSGPPWPSRASCTAATLRSTVTGARVLGAASAGARPSPSRCRTDLRWDADQRELHGLQHFFRFGQPFLQLVAVSCTIQFDAWRSSQRRMVYWLGFPPSHEQRHEQRCAGNDSHPGR